MTETQTPEQATRLTETAAGKIKELLASQPEQDQALRAAARGGEPAALAGRADRRQVDVGWDLVEPVGDLLVREVQRPGDVSLAELALAAHVEDRETVGGVHPHGQLFGIDQLDALHPSLL